MVMPNAEIKTVPKKPLKDLLAEYYQKEQYDDYLKLAYENRKELVKAHELDSKQLFVAAIKSASAAILLMTSRLSFLLKPNELLGIYYQHRHDNQFIKTMHNVKETPGNIWLPTLIAQDKSLLDYIEKSAALLLICRLQYGYLTATFAAKKEQVPEMPAELLQSMKAFEKPKESKPPVEVASSSATSSNLQDAPDIASSTAAGSNAQPVVFPLAATSNPPTQFFESKPKDPMQDRRAAVDFLIQEPLATDYVKYVDVAYQWRTSLIRPGTNGASLKTMINPEFLEKAALDNASSAQKVLSSARLCYLLAPQAIKDILTKHQLDANSFPPHVANTIQSLDQASSSTPAPK